MCFHDILSETNDGNIFLSVCKNHYKVSFYHLVMVYNKKDFGNLYYSLHTCLEEIRTEIDKDDKSIVFSTPLQSMKLRFSPKDIEQLHYLVESAWLCTNNDIDSLITSLAENSDIYH